MEDGPCWKQSKRCDKKVSCFNVYIALSPGLISFFEMQIISISTATAFPSYYCNHIALKHKQRSSWDLCWVSSLRALRGSVKSCTMAGIVAASVDVPSWCVSELSGAAGGLVCSSISCSFNVIWAKEKYREPLIGPERDRPRIDLSVKL